MAIERDQLATLIRAATRWIDASRPAKQSHGFTRRLKGLLSVVPGKGGASRV